MTVETHPDADRIECLPVLPSLDIGETVNFYQDGLGFRQLVYRTKDYLIVRRDEFELHFWLTDDRNLCEKTSVYIRGGGIGRLHAEFKANGVGRMTELEVRPWNMEEFHVHDPHGNLLRFGRIPASK